MSIEDSRERQIFASHHQFYIGDPESFDNLLLESSTQRKQAFKDRIHVAHGVLCIVTGTYGKVRLRIEIHSNRPVLKLAAWDHVTESPLDLDEGTIRVANCLNEVCDEFPMKCGRYRVRVCHANLAGAVASGKGEDWYLVQLWPSRAETSRVLKRWTPKSHVV